MIRGVYDWESSYYDLNGAIPGRAAAASRSGDQNEKDYAWKFKAEVMPRKRTLVLHCSMDIRC
jgi:hypothetical protein